MAGIKRSRDGKKVETVQASDFPYISVFEGFRSELDEHHDRREKIIKASRDITAQSKKIIFALQRARELGQPIHQSITKQIAPMYTSINGLFSSIVPDLKVLSNHRYQRQISPGIQEYMEAVLFQHYLETQKLMTHDEASAIMPPGIMITYEDYALGLFDMTGELMRFAITYIATNQKLPGRGGGTSNILSDMQEMRSQLEMLNVSGSYGLGRDFEGKLKTTKSSVEKVESGVYSMIVRGKERPKGWRPDTTLVEVPKESDQVESY